MEEPAFKVQPGGAYEGPWARYGPSGEVLYWWTVTTIWSIPLFIGLTIIIMFSEHRAWLILQSTIQWFKLSSTPIAPSAENEADEWVTDALLPQVEGDKQQEITLHEAFRDLTAIGHCLVIQWRWVPPESKRSRWYAAAAAFCVVLFLALEVGIPYLITETPLGSPLVLSKATDACIHSTANDYKDALFNSVLIIDNIFNQCVGKAQTQSECNAKYYLRDASIETKRVEKCPFSSELCVDGVLPLQITHHNITAFELGVNSKAALSLSHRLECSPLRQQKLLDHFSTHSWMSISNWIDITLPSDILPHLMLDLNTRNGPNRKYPDEQSGPLAAEKGGPTDITVLPNLVAEKYVIENPLFLKPSFRRRDGRPFVIIFRGGNRKYWQPMQDPFFAAHKNIPIGKPPNDNTEVFISDYEATALGCVEQYRFCSPAMNYCSDWGVKSNTSKQVLEMMTHRNLVRRDHEAGELQFLFRMMTTWTSVYDHLAVGIAQGLRTLKPTFQIKGVTQPESTHEQWVIESDHWFQHAIMNSIMYIRLGAHYNMFDPNLDGEEEDESQNELNLCGRILYQDSSYVNINLMGAGVTVWILVIVWILSLSFIRAFIGWSLRLISQAARSVRTLWRTSRPSRTKGFRVLQKWFARPTSFTRPTDEEAELLGDLPAEVEQGEYGTTRLKGDEETGGGRTKIASEFEIHRDVELSEPSMSHEEFL
jgi:hypothetical protein